MNPYLVGAIAGMILGCVLTLVAVVWLANVHARPRSPRRFEGI